LPKAILHPKFFMTVKEFLEYRLENPKEYPLTEDEKK
jgi:hypothetical protein